MRASHIQLIPKVCHTQVIMTIVRELMYEGIIQQRIGWEKGQTRFQAQPINHLQHFLLIFTKLPTARFVIPNLNRDMHDGTIREGDTWLKNNLNRYIQWAKMHNSLFILTFDESDLLNHNNNHIFTIFCGQMIKRGIDTTQINHYNVLRTIEDIYGLPYAGNAANVKTITHCWK